MRLSLKTAACMLTLFCISLALLSTAGPIAQWLAPTLLLVSAIAAICLAAGAAGKLRAFAVAYLGTTLMLVLLPWQQPAYISWRVDSEDYTLDLAYDLFHSTEGTPQYIRRSPTGSIRVYEPTVSGMNYYTFPEAEAAGIDIDALPRFPSKTQFRPLFYSVAFIWLGCLAGGLAAWLHGRTRQSSNPQPASPRL